MHIDLKKFLAASALMSQGLSAGCLITLDTGNTDEAGDGDGDGDTTESSTEAGTSDTSTTA